MTILDMAKRLIGFNKSEKTIAQISLYVTRNSNEWNTLAIQIASEEKKLPSQRKNVFCHSSFPNRSISKTGKTMTTDEWNKIALSRVSSL